MNKKSFFALFIGALLLLSIAVLPIKSHYFYMMPAVHAQQTTATPDVSAYVSLGAMNTDIVSSLERDLAKAGYTQIKQAASIRDRFITPPFYFHVSDAVTDPASEAPDIVMIAMTKSPNLVHLTQPMYDQGTLQNHPFAIVGGIGGEETWYDGRIGINITKGTTYIGIIGPNKQKAENLATMLSAGL